MRYADLSEAITGFPLERIVVFDTETTGVESWRDEILSIAICDAFGNKLFGSLVRPTKHKSWPDATKVNGIHPKDVKSAPTIKEITPEIRKHLLGNKLLVAYNADFDISFLLESGVFEEWPSATFDVMKEYATVRGTKRSNYGGGFRWSKLRDCADSYGYRFNAHDALEDTRATAFCYRALLSDEKYLNSRMGDLIERVRHVGLGQTKATTENVIELVEDGITSSVAGELRLGAISRGKNAGAPRYECFVHDKCVGVQGFGALENIQILYSLSDDDKLPKSIPCKALLSATGKTARCSAQITARGKLRADLIDAAEKERAALGEERVSPHTKPQALNELGSPAFADAQTENAPITTNADDIKVPEAWSSSYRKNENESHGTKSTAKSRRGCLNIALSFFLVLLGISEISNGISNNNLWETCFAVVLITAGVYVWPKDGRKTK